MSVAVSGPANGKYLVFWVNQCLFLTSGISIYVTGNTDIFALTLEKCFLAFV